MNLKKKKRILSIAFLVFCVIQGFFIFKRVHNYPFMIFDMYSRPEQTSVLQNHYVMIMDGDTLNTTKLPIMAEGRLLHNVSIYHHLKDYNYDYWHPALTSRQDRLGDNKIVARSDRLLRNSVNSDETYPRWLHQHLEDLTGRSFDQLNVSQVVFDRSSGRIVSSKNIINYTFEKP